MTYGYETGAVTRHESKLFVAQWTMKRAMLGITRKNRKRND